MEVFLAKAGDEILDEHGYGLIFRKTAGETNGELLEMDAFYRPATEAPPLHYHPRQAEHFEVLSGEFRVIRRNEAFTYRAGEAFDIPAAVPHAMYNVAAEKGHLRWQTRPALNSEAFFEVTWSMQRDEQSQARGLKEILHLAVIFDEYAEEVRLSSTIQRLVLKLLAPLGRLLGYRAAL
jgi:quercetin dioxygenase-like cupin family protein